MPLAKGGSINKQNNMAEITKNNSFGKAIQETILKYKISSFLEIGAFDGDGSTQVIAKALLKKKTQKVKLFSLEYNKERFKNLVANTRQYSFVTAINESSIGKDSFTAWDFEKDVWLSSYNGINYKKKEVKKWHEYDVEAIRNTPDGFLDASKEIWDAVLIDGGEFTGYDEYRLVKYRTKCIMLDDCYRAFKTNRARKELLLDPDWQLEWEETDRRNGAAIFIHKTLKKESFLFRGLRFLGL